MVFTSSITRRCSSLLLLLSAIPLAARCCSGTLYLTIDTGSMSQAETIARILERHHTRATLFLANEPTVRGDETLDPAWAPYWRRLAADGSVFGSHTWRHGKVLADRDAEHVTYLVHGRVEALTRDQFCEELNRPRQALQKQTGIEMQPLWRAPGGHTSPNAIRFAAACGYRHVGWSAAGFLGDELPSDRYPNEALLRRAIAHLRSGDILMMHFGIRSRKEPFAPALDPLLAALEHRGFCFDTLKGPS